jgi:virginiamycin B lyase
MKKTLSLSIGLLLLAALCSAQVTVTEFPLPAGSASPRAIAVGPDGALWFTEFDPNKDLNRIGRITTAGAITEYPLASGSGPQSITAGPDGAMWFTEGLANRIGRITVAGTVTEFPALAAQALPFAITAGPDGALWFTEGGGGKIGRITTAGLATEMPLPTDGAGPTGITKGPDGALWFTEFIGNHIGRIAPGGAAVEFPLPSSFSWRQDIAAGPDGNLWFTEQDNDNIGRITMDHVVTLFPLTPGSSPEGITAGTDGALWFTEKGTGKIGRITIAGAITEFPVPAAGSGPEQIVKGPDGALWFTERTGNRIGRAVLPAGLLPPSMAATFGAATIAVNASTTLSFTILNRNTVALTGVAFTDNLPAGLNVAAPNGLTGSCGTGAIATTSSSISLSVGTITAGGSCTFSVNVTGIAAGSQVTTTGAVTSANGGAGNTASATVAVTAAGPTPDLTVALTHGAGFTQGQTGALVTITVANSGSGPTTASVSLTAKPAASLTATALTGAGWTCSVASLTCTRADALAAGSSYPAVTLALNVAANAPATVTNTAGVSGGGELVQNTANDSASDFVSVQPALVALVSTSPAGLAFSVDGVSFTGPQSLVAGSHVIATRSPQSGAAGTQYVFKSWSDGGAISHTVTPAASTIYTANFDTQYQLTVGVSPAGAGTVTPAGGFVAAGSVVNLQVTPAPGFTFVSWSGPVGDAAAAATSVAMTAPVSVTAVFKATAAAASVATSPAGLSFTIDGTSFNTPQSLAAGSSHVIAAKSPQSGPAGTQYVFKNWSDGGAISHTVTASAAPTTYTANFDTQYQLTVAVSPAGAGTVTPAGGFVTAGSSVNLQATPASGFSFVNWSGPVSATGTASTTVAMTGPVSVTAIFKAGPGAQTIDFPPLPNRNLGDAPFALTATASSGLPVTFTIVSGPAKLTGNTVTLIGVGTVVVQASQSGNATVPAATPVTRGFDVVAAGALSLAANPPEAGSIVVTPPGPVTPGATVRVEAQANPGFLFTGFSGAVSGFTNPQSFSALASNTVTANFAPISKDPADQFAFAMIKGNPLPPAQTVPLPSAAAVPSVVVISGTGGDWLLAAPSAVPPAASISLNSAVVPNLTAGSYVGYVLATSAAGQQRVLTVRLMVDVVSITGALDAAGFRGPSLASEELATAFGFNQAVDAKVAASLPLDTTLGGTTLTITDSAGIVRAAQLLYVSSTQVNFLTPAGMAPGPGTLTIENSIGQKGAMPLTIQTAAPGLFSAGQNGKGVAAAVVQRYASGGSVSTSLAAACDSAGPCSPIPIDVGNPDDQVFLSLYGTGIRGASALPAVSVTVGGIPVEVLFAGAQPQFPGLDQVNVKLASSLAGKGDVVVNVTVDGHAANPVSIRIR